jgi:hypothetical protein
LIVLGIERDELIEDEVVDRELDRILVENRIELRRVDRQRDPKVVGARCSGTAGLAAGRQCK